MIYVYLFTMFARIGLFSFGGGLAMLPLIFQSVQEFGVMSYREFSDLVALSQVTPGPIAVNAATFVGFNYAGLPGAAIATFGVCLPSFVLMLIVLKFIEKFNESRGIQGAFAGIRPVTVGLIGAAVIFVSETVLVNGALISEQLFTGGIEYFNLIPMAIFAVTILLVGVFKMRPIKIMIIMGVAGALLCG
ncbi:MAG: chromate transporter [Bacillota bacterium]|nr:chromate transporter [Bacillota bacterium]